MRFPKGREGFTLLELIIFAAIFVMAGMAFITILISVTRIQTKQASSAEVAQQSQYLLQTIQQFVEASSLVEIPADTPTSTLKLRMSSSTADPTYLYVSSGVLYLKQTDSGTPQALTSNRVNVTDISFVKRSNPPAHDSVAVNFTVSYNANTVQQQFSHALDTTVARVSAATFDSNVIPSANNTYKIGATSQIWQSINDIIYFTGNNVGIGVSNPQQVLEVNGGIRINTTSGQPGCTALNRGTFWVAQAGDGAKDSVQVCVKKADGTYFWAPIY